MQDEERRKQELKNKEEEKNKETNLLDITDPWANNTPAAPAPVITQPTSQAPPVNNDPFNLNMPMPNNNNPTSSTLNDPWSQLNTSGGAGSNVSAGPSGVALPTAQTNATLASVTTTNDPWGFETSTQAPAPSVIASDFPNTSTIAPSTIAPSNMSIPQSSMPAMTTGASTLAPSQIDPWGSPSVATEVPKSMTTQPVLPGLSNNDPFGDMLSKQEENKNHRKTPTQDLSKQFLVDLGVLGIFFCP